MAIRSTFHLLLAIHCCCTMMGCFGMVSRRHVAAAFSVRSSRSSRQHSVRWMPNQSTKGGYHSRRAMTPSTRSTTTTMSETHAFPSSHTTVATEKVMRDILARVRDVNWMPDEIEQSLIDFSVNGIRLGTVRPDMAKLWCSIQLTTDGEMGGNNGDMDATTGSTATSNNDSAAFCMACDDTDGWYMTLNANVCGTTFESRSAAVAQITEQLRHRNIVTGWRNELYPIAQSFYEQPVFCMERAAVPFLGALEYGVHINGLVHGNQVEQQQQQLSEADTAPVRMWMARRSATKSKFPGMLDHIAAGGQPMGLSLTDNVVKECWEEAGIPASITTTSALQPAGAVSYRRYAAHKDVVERCVVFCYDLVLPVDFVPKPIDGEVQEFFLYSIDELLASMSLDCPDPIKPNCYSVIIDFLLRRGYLSPDTPGYLDVLRELRSGDCR